LLSEGTVELNLLELINCLSVFQIGLIHKITLLFTTHLSTQLRYFKWPELENKLLVDSNNREKTLVTKSDGISGFLHDRSDLILLSLAVNQV